eukprot:scaffold1642_cov252-Pinguiococcus_pyrenoidosus.AAC.8
MACKLRVAFAIRFVESIRVPLRPPPARLSIRERSSAGTRRPDSPPALSTMSDSPKATHSAKCVLADSGGRLSPTWTDLRASARFRAGPAQQVESISVRRRQ